MQIQNSLHILIIDDDPLNIEIISAAASAPGRILHVAKTIAEALTIINKQVLSLILLDLFLPDGDGRTVLRQLKEQKRTYDIPVIVVTANNSPIVRKECIDLGAVDYFNKPLLLSLIKQSIIAHLNTDSTKNETHEKLDNNRQIINLQSRPDFIEEYSQLSKIAEASHSELWLGIVSVDNIETLSAHLTADATVKILRHLLLTIAVTVGERGFCARWGENEFLTLFSNMTANTVTEIHRQIIANNEETTSRIIPEAKSDIVELSVGLAEISVAETLNEALIVAERYLLAAKSVSGEKIIHSQLQTTFPDKKILIVDDDPVISGMIQFRLLREGFKTVVSGNGVEGWRDAIKYEPDLITLDIKMPMMDGFELLKKLRNDARFSNTPILLLTTQGNEKDVTRGFELGASDYMVKPFSPSELLVRIRRLMMNAVSSS